MVENRAKICHEKKKQCSQSSHQHFYCFQYDYRNVFYPLIDCLRLGFAWDGIHIYCSIWLRVYVDNLFRYCNEPALVFIKSDFFLYIICVVLCYGVSSFWNFSNGFVLGLCTDTDAHIDIIFHARVKQRLIRWVVEFLAHKILIWICICVTHVFMCSSFC